MIKYLLIAFSLMSFELTASSPTCPTDLLRELTQQSSRNVDDLVSQLRNARYLSSINHTEFNQDFHRLLMQTNDLSRADKALLFQRLSNGELDNINDYARELLELSTMEPSAWASSIRKAMKDIPNESDSIFFGPYGVDSSLYHTLSGATEVQKTEITRILNQAYPNADKVYGGEQNARAALRQIALALNPPHQTFQDALQSLSPREAYINSVSNFRAPMNDALGEMEFESVFPIARSIRDSVNWQSGQVDEVMFVGSYPNGFARAGHSDLDVHFIKDGVGTEPSTRRQLVSKLYEDLYEVFITRRLPNMPPGDDYIGTNPREFFNRSPFTFRVTENELILRVNSPVLRVDRQGNPINSDIQFTEYNLEY